MSGSASIADDGTLSIIKGDTIDLYFEWFDITVDEETEEETEVPINLTGATIASQIKTVPGGSFASLTFEVTDVVAAAGTWTLHADAEDVKKLRKTEYWWDVQITYADGVVETVLPTAQVINLIDVTL